MGKHTPQGTDRQLLVLARRLGTAIFAEVPVTVFQSEYQRPLVTTEDFGSLLSGIQDGNLVQVHLGRALHSELSVRIAVAADGERRWNSADGGVADLTIPGQAESSYYTKTGESAFDELVKCLGQAAMVLAFATHATRAQVLSLAMPAWGTLVLKMQPPLACVGLGPFPDTCAEPANILEDVRDNIARLVHVVSLVRAVDRPLEQRLAENARTDPCTESRHRNLECLVALDPGSQTAEATCIAALRDPDPAVRLLAASQCPGDDAFIVVADLLLADGIAPGLKRTAQEQLTTAYPAAIAWSVVINNLPKRGTEWRAAILRLAATSTKQGWIDNLCIYVADCPHEDCEVIVPVARALQEPERGAHADCAARPPRGRGAASGHRGPGGDGNCAGRGSAAGSGAGSGPRRSRTRRHRDDPRSHALGRRRTSFAGTGGGDERSAEPRGGPGRAGGGGAGGEVRASRFVEHRVASHSGSIDLLLTDV